MKPVDRVPVAPKALPIVGHSLGLFRDPSGFLSSLPAYGDLVTIKVGRLAATVVCDPELSGRVLRDDRTFDTGGMLYDRAREAAGNNVITCPHADHRRQRRLLQPAFRPGRLAGYFQTELREVMSEVDAWCDGQTIDPLTEMHLLSTRVLLSTLFGSTDLSSKLREDIVEDVSVVITGIFRRMLTPRFLRDFPTPGHRRYQQARSRMHRVVGQIIANRRNDTVDHGDLLSTMMVPSDGVDKDRAFSDAEISDQIMGFLAAGTDTTADTLSWALYVLAHDSALQERLHGEVEGIDFRTLAFEDLPQLEVTRAIVTETLRNYPPVWILTRTVATDTELGGYDIPAGTTLICSPYLIHHRSDLYPVPDSFEIDRWLGTGTSRARDEFIPFGLGARKCLGDVFGMTEATVALAYIAANWWLRPLAGQLLPKPARSGTLKPRKGHLLYVTKRGGTA